MKAILRNIYLFVALGLISLQLTAQEQVKHIVFNWKGVHTIREYTGDIQAYCADGLSNSMQNNYMPYYTPKTELPAKFTECKVSISDTKWLPIADTELSRLTFPVDAPDTLSYTFSTGIERGKSYTILELLPITKNASGEVFRLESCNITYSYSANPAYKSTGLAKSYADHSLLAHGNWYKIKTNQTGIHFLTYSDLQSMGIDMNTVKPSNIRIYGHGGAMLPETYSVNRIDDLVENAISVKSAGGNNFSPGDTIFFYGTSPNQLKYNPSSKKFEHITNLYSDFTYYFINFDREGGLRVSNQSQAVGEANYTSITFTHAFFYNEDKENIIRSGKQWVGSRLEGSYHNLSLPQFTIPDMLVDKQCWLQYRVLGKSAVTTYFKVKVNNSEINTNGIARDSQYQYANQRIESRAFFTESNTLNISFDYQGDYASIGWFDWVEINVTRALKFNGGQMSFTDPVSALAGRITRFNLESAQSNINIWNITNPLQPGKVEYSRRGNICAFKANTDTLLRFIAWDNTDLIKPVFVEKVANQDLHGIASADMLIVVHKDFLAEANRLADFHRIHDGLKVEVVDNEMIFNEYSSGSPDIAAIRNFAGMLYNRPDEGAKLKCMLLFGDGSYDFKSRIPVNTNRVLTYQTVESLYEPNSYASDDFFCMLDAGEGKDCEGFLDIGVGRFPVQTAEQAKIVVDKTIAYASNNAETLGNWRTNICLISDDGNINLHFDQVEHFIYPLLNSLVPEYNISKVYQDAYKPVSTPAGERCPDVNTAIKNNIENGALVVGYTGHGGVIGWAHESILSVPEIDALSNYNKLPVFITATCEFSRFDDPGFISGGERLLLNPLGGGAALFTTTRLAQAYANIDLTLLFYDTLFSKKGDRRPRFGEILAYAKNGVQSTSVSWIRNFALLGDPALTLAFPFYNVQTTHINGKPVGEGNDTILALSPVEVKGMITNNSGQLVSSFNGEVEIKVFDKQRTLQTLGAETGDYKANFVVRDNYIYQGRASVINGEFLAKFIVPRDIDYSLGTGKISLYAFDEPIDAIGYSNDFFIGGSGATSDDHDGPEIRLFMDDTTFVSGNVTGPSPTLIAKLSDINGINTMNSGIGHDIIAVLDNDENTALVLNNYYKADLDSYRTGVVRYRFNNLSEGEHVLRLKVWDVFNNSSEAEIKFKVSANLQISITSVTAFPNPTREGVKVNFEINQFDIPVKAGLTVYDRSGRLVYKSNPEPMLAKGKMLGTLEWNGLTQTGVRPSPGLYLVSVYVSNGISEGVKSIRVISM